MATIAVLGTGLLGAAFAENLISKGHTVRVWNRTRQKLAPLVEKGAMAAADPAECVRGADRVHLVLSEDTAVDDVVEQLRPGLGDGVPVVDFSTNLPAKVLARFERLRAAGVRYVSSPVFMAPKHARTGTGLIVMSGPQADDEELRPALEEMTGKFWYLGERVDLAAIYKLAGNSFFFAVTAALGDTLALGRANGVDESVMMELFQEFKPGSGLHTVHERIATACDGTPSFEMTMAHKDARLTKEASGAEHLLVLPAVIAGMERAIDNGDGGADFAAFAKG
ncbi:MAG: NAD(P)-dependent oxidoreductase [Planctomycetota bacterium]|nr:NAD(P)-dependent oxidoreductase [Planctomycetota bacterium]